MSYSTENKRKQIQIEEAKLSSALTCGKYWKKKEEKRLANVGKELLCSALSIKEKERLVGTLDNNLKEKGERVLALCLVGKVLTTKVVNKEAFINVMNSIWRVREGVDIEALEGNVFAFHFKNTADEKLVQSGGPWTFDRAIIAMEEPAGTEDIEHMKFNSVEIWVQIHNLPLLWMPEDTVGGDKIAAVNFTARREILDRSVKGARVKEKKDK
ncbi:hypothetical protein Q3G72_024074 [Acer saccharum]|nr:hypothetical protein Q3G72_024074 [Acer saccharum]